MKAVQSRPAVPAATMARKYTKRRLLGVPLLVLILTLAMNLVARPAAAGTDSGCLSFGSSFAIQPISGDGTGLRVGCARDSGGLRSLAGNDNDLIAAIDFKVGARPDQFRQAMNQWVNTTRADMSRGLSLSQALTVRAERDSVGYSALSEVRYGGSIQVVGDSIVFVVPAGDIGTAGFWDGFWKKLIAGLVVVASAVVIGGICLAAFAVGAPPAAPVCGAIAGGLSAGIGELVSAALDGRPIDGEAWGNAVGAAIAGAAGGAFLGALAQYFASGSRSLIASLQVTVRRYATIFDSWRAPLDSIANLLNPDIAQMINNTIQRIVRGVGATRLRVMPLGDSITFGYASSDGSGYLARFREIAEVGSSQVELVGSQRSGPSALANEGHSGWTISQVAGITDSALRSYQPNVVLLHIGTNDMGNNVDPGGAPGRLGGLIDQILRTAPGVTVVVSTIVPAASGTTQSRINAYNAAIPGVVAARQRAGEHVRLVDMSSVTTANLADGLHPDDRGYQKMAVPFYRGVLDAADSGWISGPAVPSCPGAGGRWIPQGEIASGTGTGAGPQVRFADLDGDGRADYLVVHQDGSIDAWRNTGGAQPGRPGWSPLGEVAAGVGAAASDVVHLADINGDRRADYVVVRSQGAVDAWMNAGPNQNGQPVWLAQARVASGTGSSGTVMFADINGDRLADYLVAGRTNAVSAWLNTGPGQNGAFGWNPRGEIAAGVGTANDLLAFADLTCDRLDDYALVKLDGSIEAWRNVAGDQEGRPVWSPMGRIASGITADGQIHLADINGDGLDDYLVVGPNGSVQSWQNNGGDPS
ncbi:FG-GAP-like repeat-containing protein [Actinoplanes sp. NPDC089786]|uniref:FG-GAP-like repeat-containing protein n=1 Tax=Actinoplanes sp. NPDC089786 TaxID=3155185 RepID=UPI00342362BA